MRNAKSGTKTKARCFLSCERPCDTCGQDGTISFTLPTLLFGLGWFLDFVVSASGVAAFGWVCSDDGEDRNVRSVPGPLAAFLHIFPLADRAHPSPNLT